MSLVKQMEEGLFENALFCKDYTSSSSDLIMLEKSLLQVGCDPNILQGLFYMVSFCCGGHVFIR